jgi:hypothetical protein
MPHLKIKAPAIDPIEQDFLDAIKRLQDGEPKHKKLKAQKTKGVLKVNVSTVALEAGRARTLIAVETGCRYPRVRELIKQIKGGRNTLPTTHTELIQRLRADKADLAAQVKKYQAEAMAHFQARVKAEDEAARERAAASRLRKAIARQGKVANLLTTEQ